MKYNRQINMATNSNKPLARTETGPYNIVMIIRNGTLGTNKDFFWITVISSDSALRSSLEERAKEFLNPVWIKNSDTDVTFYFPKFTGIDETSQSLSEKLADESKAPNKDYEINNCPEHALCDTQQQIISCNEGYYLDTNSNPSCQSCGNHVTSCDNTGHPIQCQTDYWSADCSKECPSNKSSYQSCDIDGLICSIGYYNNGTSCEQCENDKYTDEEGATSCKKCNVGYTYNTYKLYLPHNKSNIKC